MCVPREDRAGRNRRLPGPGVGFVVSVAVVAVALWVAHRMTRGDTEEGTPREVAGPVEGPPEASALRQAEPLHRGPPEPPRGGPNGPETPDPEAAETARRLGTILDDLRSPDRMARLDALRALAELAPRKGVEAAVPVLIEVAGDEDPVVRVRAVRVLGAIGPRAAPAVPVLRRLVHDRVGVMVARPAVEALGKIGPAASDAVEDLAPLLSDRTRHCQTAAAEALAAIGGDGLEALASHVEELLNGTGRMLLEKKIEAMGAGGRAAVPVLLRWLAARQSYAKPPNLVCIAKAIARIGPEADEAADALEALASRREPATFGPAIYALLSVEPGRVDADAVAADLVQDLGRNKYWDFDPAAKALGMIGEPAVAPVLAALRLGTSSMRRQACVALGEMGAGAAGVVPELIEEARTCGPGVRPYVLRALGRIGTKPDDVVPLLVGFLDDPKSRRAAADALGDLGAKAQAATEELRRRLGDPDDAARDSFRNALRKIEEALRRGMEAPEPEGDVF